MSHRVFVYASFVRFMMIFCGMAVGLHPGAKARTLNADFDTPNHDYRIHYFNRDNTDTNWFVSDTNAVRLSQLFDRDGSTSEGNPRGAHEGFTNIGFSEPYFQAEVGVDRDIRLEHDSNPNANTDRIIVPPWLIRDQGANSSAMRQICTHELFHTVQYGYTGRGSYFTSLSKFSYEGTATVVEDLLYDDDDDELWDSGWAYMAWAIGYLRDDTGEYLFSHSDEDADGYFTALFWRYLADQFGADRTEPHTGHDIVERFWEKASNKEDGFYTLLSDVLDEKDRYTTSANDPGTSLEKAFQDFSVACWLRRYHNHYVSGYTLTMPDPGRFYFLDEVTGHTNFYGGGGSARDNDPDDDYPFATAAYSLSPTQTSAQVTRSLRKWASHFLICDFAVPATNTARYGIGFWAQTEGGDKCWYSLAGVRANGDIDFVEQSTVTPEAGNVFHYALMQDPANPYVRLVAVVNGDEGERIENFTDLTPDYTSYFAYFNPVLEIKEPSPPSYPAYVGEYNAPDRFTVKLKVTSPSYLGSGSLKGLKPDQFSVFVGSSLVPGNQAEVLSAADMFGEYWLTVQAPVKTSPPGAALSLTVKLGGVQDTIENAVVYEKLEADQVLVIDRSGSMNKTSGGISRSAASRAAAQLFVEATGAHDQLGMVRFNGDNSVEPPSGTNAWDDAQVIWPLISMSNEFIRALTQYLIDEANPTNQLLATGYTSIGDGLYWGAKEILDNGRPGAEKWIVLLSDGHQNELTEFDDQYSLLSAAGIRVYSIALGPNCDEGHMQDIATRTGGRFYKVEADEDAITGASILSTYPSGDMMFALADAYLSIHEEVKRKSRLLETTVTVPAGGAYSTTLDLAEGGLEDALITAFFAQEGADIDLMVADPKGTPLPTPPASTNYTPEYHVAYRLDTMTNGTWTFSITNHESASQLVMLTVSAYDRQGARAELLFTQTHTNATAYSQGGYYLVGLPMPITLTLTDAQGALTNADVMAVITHPLKPDIHLHLRDDGNGQDGTAGDGVYAGIYRATTEGSLTGGSYPEDSPPPPLRGSYRVQVTATGTNHFGEPFTRIKRGAFQVYLQEQFGEDTDTDGMVDRYERLHPCLDEYVKDDGLDHDQDGVPTGEEYRLGLLPCHPDTDGGGESDGSELARGANPHDERDDLISPFVSAHVFTHPGDTGAGADWLQTNRNVVVTSFERGMNSFELYRSTNPTSGFMHVASLPKSSEGVYFDDGLSNGVVYFYRALPVSNGGSTGVMTEVFSGTPKLDPVPPSLGLALPSGGRTTTNHIDVTLHTATDVTHMRYGLTPNLSVLPWIAFSNTVTVSLGSAMPGDIIPIYAQVRDAAGNRGSARAYAKIVDTNSLATATGRVFMPLDPSGFGCTVVWLSSDFSDETTTDAGGWFTSYLPAGTYQVTLSQRGYEPRVITGLVISAGATTNIGAFNLIPEDRDADGLPDVHELRDYLTDRDAADSDGDGFDDKIELFRTRTDPTNDLSVMKLSTSSRPSEGLIRWLSESGVVYEVHSQDDNFMGSNWIFRTALTGTSDHAESEYQDPAPHPATSRFYRVVIP